MGEGRGPKNFWNSGCRPF